MYMKYTSSPASFNLFIPELNLPALPASMTWPSILDTKKKKNTMASNDGSYKMYTSQCGQPLFPQEA